MFAWNTLNVEQFFQHFSKYSSNFSNVLIMFAKIYQIFLKKFQKFP